MPRYVPAGGVRGFTLTSALRVVIARWMYMWTTVCVMRANGKSKTSHILTENALWPFVISSRSVVRV